MPEEVQVVPTPINPIEIKGAIAFSAEHARVWAEGTDSEVEVLGGEHSAKGWAAVVEDTGKDYTDEQIAIAKSEMTSEINRQSQAAVSSANSYTDSAIADEAAIRAGEDNNLQSQIDAITSASDVFDIVGTYAELLAYDTTTVPVNDIIKVLVDSTHDDAASYYRWTGEEWDYIGSEGASYTKSEADAKFLTQTAAESTYATQSDLSTGLATKQNTLTAGTGISISSDTISGVAMTGATGSVAGSEGLVPAPTATDNTKFLKGDGTWTSIPAALPSQTGQSGKFLTTDGTDASWAAVDALPSQTGQSGKFLTTDGTDASWTTLSGLQNTATGSNSLTILGTAATNSNSINIGVGSSAGTQHSLVIGKNAYTAAGSDSSICIGNSSYSTNPGGIAIGGGETHVSGNYGIAIGYASSATAESAIAISGTSSIGAWASEQYSIQIGPGKNSNQKSLSIGLDSTHNYQLLNSSGKVPVGRLTDFTGADGTNAGTRGAVPAPASSDNTKFLRGDGTWATVQASASAPTLTWYKYNTGTTITIADTSSANLVKVYKNGILLEPSEDYSISGTTLTLATALVDTDKITVEVF